MSHQHSLMQNKPCTWISSYIIIYRANSSQFIYIWLYVYIAPNCWTYFTEEGWLDYCLENEDWTLSKIFFWTSVPESNRDLRMWKYLGSFGATEVPKNSYIAFIIWFFLQIENVPYSRVDAAKTLNTKVNKEKIYLLVHYPFFFSLQGERTSAVPAPCAYIS